MYYRKIFFCFVNTRMNKTLNFNQTAMGYDELLKQRIALENQYSKPIGEILHNNIQQKQLPDALVTSNNIPTTFTEFIVDANELKLNNEQILARFSEMIGKYVPPNRIQGVMDSILEKVNVEQLEPIGSLALDLFVKKNYRSVKDKITPDTFVNFIVGYIQKKNKTDDDIIKPVESSIFITPPKSKKESDSEDEDELIFKSPPAKSSIDLEIAQIKNITSANVFFEYLKDNYSSHYRGIKNEPGKWREKRDDFIQFTLPSYYSTVGKGFKKQKKLRNNIRFMSGTGGAYEEGSKAELMPIGGKYCVNMKLLAKNILSIKYQTNNCHIPEFSKRTNISDGLRDTIMELIVDEKFDKNGSYKKLDENDKLTFQTFVDVLHINVGLSDSKESIKKRFQILLGEFNAGNESVKKDLQNVIQKCVQRKLFSANSAFEILQQL